MQDVLIFGFAVFVSAIGLLLTDLLTTRRGSPFDLSGQSQSQEEQIELAVMQDWILRMLA